MAKKQTRRSISVSRATYERLKAFCEANNISMSQFVETRVGDFLGSAHGDRAHIRTATRPAGRADAASGPAARAQARGRTGGSRLRRHRRQRRCR